MASNAEILSLQLIAGAWGCDLVETTAVYVPPPGYAIKGIIAQEETVIDYAFQWEGKGLNKEEIEITAADKYWIGATLAVGCLITAHDLFPISRIKLTSGAVMVYFCKGPSTASGLGVTTAA